MRKLFKKRLLGIPVAALLILALTAGVVMAAYPVISGTVTVEVREALTVEYEWMGSWHSAGDGFNISIMGAYPGECATIGVRITNASSVPLWAQVVITPPSGITVKEGSDLFGPGLSVPGGGANLERSFTACVDTDAPAGNYTVSIVVNRG